MSHGPAKPPRTPAEKLAMVMALYEEGLLCQCSYQDDDGIEHEDDCEAPAKMRELLSLE